MVEVEEEMIIVVAVVTMMLNVVVTVVVVGMMVRHLLENVPKSVTHKSEWFHGSQKFTFLV